MTFQKLSAKSKFDGFKVRPNKNKQQQTSVNIYIVLMYVSFGLVSKNGKVSQTNIWRHT